MRSILRPSERARLFDGESAQPRIVSARLEGDRLIVAGADGEETVPIARLVRERVAGRLILHRDDAPDWRLIVDGTGEALAAALPDRHRVTGRHRRAIGGAAAAVLALLAAGWLFSARLVAWAAPLVPRTIAVQAGRPLVDLIAGGERRCADPAGEAALRTLVARVMPNRPVEPIDVRVGRSEGVNAFTLPGGQVVLLSGLIGAARGPEEVAGVLAHEFGHVQKRHPTQALIRHFGLDLVLQGLGGNLGALASTGLFLSNSRAAEREADGVAIELMQAGAVQPGGLADFFRRMAGAPERKARSSRFGRLATLAATHPSDGTRERLFRAAAGTWPTRPILTPEEWRALRGICRASGSHETKTEDRSS